MNGEVRGLLADSGPLLEFRARMNPPYYEVICLVFEKGILRVSCDGDTDEVEIAVGVKCSGCDVVEDHALSDQLGSFIEYGWTLKNHSGYVDGFQLRLMKEQRETYCCQFEVAASALHIVPVGEGLRA